MVAQQITVNGLGEEYQVASNVDWIELSTSTVDGQVNIDVSINADNINT